MKLRTRRRRPEEPLDPLLPVFADDGNHATPVAAWSPDALEGIERAELRELVRRNIARLPESHRTVLLLRDVEELDTEETSYRLGLPVATVKTRLHRARQALRTLLAAELGEGRDRGPRG